MKKLMIALAVLAAAVAANAATVSWSAAGKSISKSADDDSGNNRAYGYTVMMFLASDRTAVVSALEGGSTDLSTWAKDTKYTTKTGATSGSFDVASAGDVDVFAVVLDTPYSDSTSTRGPAKNYMISANVTTDAYVSPNLPKNPVAWTESAPVGSTWNSLGGDVPEPTSGLLLLLGVAGLALRRKQA